MSAAIIQKLKAGAPSNAPASVITLAGAFAFVQLAQASKNAGGIVGNPSELATRQDKLRIATIAQAVVTQLKAGTPPNGPASAITLDDAFFLIPFARRGLQAARDQPGASSPRSQ
jgi:hypothetical protein